MYFQTQYSYDLKTIQIHIRHMEKIYEKEMIRFETCKTLLAKLANLKKK